ncbi:MAG: hypothetical protein ACYC4Q_09005 [Victivallaceae bacterium]
MQNKKNKTVKKNNRLLIASAAALLVVAAWLLLANFREFWPSDAMVDDLKKKRKKVRKELEEITSKNEDSDAQFKKLEKEIKLFYFAENQTQPDAFMRKKIEDTAKSTGAIIKSLGDIRKNQLIKGIYSLELTLSVEGSNKQVIMFMDELQKNKPKFYWQQYNIRAAGIRDPRKITINGSLAIICMENQDITQIIGAL